MQYSHRRCHLRCHTALCADSPAWVAPAAACRGERADPAPPRPHRRPPGAGGPHCTAAKPCRERRKAHWHDVRKQSRMRFKASSRSYFHSQPATACLSADCDLDVHDESTSRPPYRRPHPLAACNTYCYAHTRSLLKFPTPRQPYCCWPCLTGGSAQFSSGGRRWSGFVGRSRRGIRRALATPLPRWRREAGPTLAHLRPNESADPRPWHARE